MLIMGPTGTGPLLFYCASIGKVLILTMLITGHTKDLAIQVFTMMMIGPTGTGPLLFYCPAIGKKVLILTMLITGPTKDLCHPDIYYDDDAAHWYRASVVLLRFHR